MFQSETGMQKFLQDLVATRNVFHKFAGSSFVAKRRNCMALAFMYVWLDEVAF